MSASKVWITLETDYLSRQSLGAELNLWRHDESSVAFAAKAFNRKDR